MKKIILFIAALAIVSCNDEPKNYATFSGKITDQNSDSLRVKKGDYSKVITVNEDGTFSDTLKLEAGTYRVFDGTEYASVFLKNGFDIYMTLDTKMFDHSIKFSGLGSEHSNFLADKYRLNETLFDLDELVSLDSVQLEAKFTSIRNEITEFYDAHQNVDTSITNNGLKSADRTIASYNRYIQNIHEVTSKLPPGMKSPEFTDYENYNGEKTSLSDLKGKYVYVDIWATWCGPCKMEIPYLKEVGKKYADKNIAFVSISVDDPKRNGSWEQANENWRNMVKEEDLHGIQLFSPDGFESQFIKDYISIGIPRFLLINPEGNIVTAFAPRPSSDALITLFDQENI